MFRDSAAFISWATNCIVTRGYVNIADTNFLYNGSNRATYGDEYYGVGKANDSVVSLGDGGIAILTFSLPIANGPGNDFAVFENGISDSFLELGFVEVSSDGITYVRFPSSSLTQTQQQIGTFGEIDATKINNFAGKYRAGFGTPFDLQDISDSSGINLNQIGYVRIIDAVGCIQSPYSTHDSQGNIVNDPWPTPFWSCGFDLDAVGVINAGQESTGDKFDNHSLVTYPSPVTTVLHLVSGNTPMISYSITNLQGLLVLRENIAGTKASVDLSGFPEGFYFISVTFRDGNIVSKKIIRK